MIFIRISTVYTYVFLYIYIYISSWSVKEIERNKKRKKENQDGEIESEQAGTANSSAPSRAFRLRAAISSDPAVVDVFKRPVCAPHRNRTGSSAELERNSETERVRATSASEAEVGSKDSIKRQSDVEADSRGQFRATQQGRAGSQRDFKQNMFPLMYSLKIKKIQRNKQVFVHEILIFFTKCRLPRFPKTRQASRQASRQLIFMKHIGNTTF